MTPMAWSPLAGAVYPAWGDTFNGQTESRIRLELERQGTYYNKPAWIIMLAWLLKHPAVIIPIIGTTNPKRIRDCSEAVDITYRREDWYALWQARTGQPVA
jgi:predicted oxidoreductase